MVNSKIRKELIKIKYNGLIKSISDERGLILIDYHTIRECSDGFIKCEILYSGDPSGKYVNFEFYNDDSFLEFLKDFK